MRKCECWELKKYRSCIPILIKIVAKQRARNIKTRVMMNTSSTNVTMFTLLQRLQRILSWKIYPIVVYDTRVSQMKTLNIFYLVFY